MFRFERTRDLALVRQVVTHPDVWPFISDDFSPPAADFQPTAHESLWYIAASDDKELLGIWLFEVRGACWEVHTCLLSSARGRRGLAAAKALARWIWDETPCRVIVTHVPDDNPAAAWFARAAGMREFGRIPRSWLKRGVLHDQILLGICRP